MLFIGTLLMHAQLPDDFPALTVNKTGETAPGYIFLNVSAEAEGVGYYVFMIDDDGTPFKYRKLEHDYSYDFKVQPNGLLSYAQFVAHHSYTGGGDCIHMVMDENMEIVDSVQLKNGYIAEAHDFQILPNGHVLAFGYYLTQMDLSDIVDGGYPNALVSGGIVQEFDQDKNVVWQWRSWDHYDYMDYNFGARSGGQIISQFHLNTINLDTDDNMFLATPSWTKKINRQTGEIMWHLGGDENQFSFVGVDSLEGVGDVTGHAFHRLANGNVLLYDNGPRRGTGTSEAHEYKLDEENLIAEKIQTFTPASEIKGWHRGSAQRLSNGNTLVGWGGASGDPIPTCTEFDPDGNTVLEVYFDNPLVESYRAVRFPYPPVHRYESFLDEAALGNIYELMQGDTLDIGVKVKITDLVSAGYNEFIVYTWDYAPEFPRFEGRAPMVLPKRVILSQYSINFIGGEISFDAGIFGIQNPENITIYFRPVEGQGEFIPLSTTYNSVTDEITAVFNEFGEYIFTYPDLDQLIISPEPQSPGNDEIVNFSTPVKLEWSQDGFFRNFDLQVAIDESFTEPVTDETGLMSTVYELNSLKVNHVYYWRVKMTNDAGESEWSETANFNTAAPYVELTAPNGNEVLTRGLDYFIEWNGTSVGELILSLYKDNEMVQVIDTVENTNAFLWSIPVELDSACNYYISARSLSDSAIQDVSDTTFSINEIICTGTEVPGIKLISPNGGELIYMASETIIKWENNTGETVKVELFKDGVPVEILYTGLDESEVGWIVSSDLQSSSGYRIRITSENTGDYSDASNSDFEITTAVGIEKQAISESMLTVYPNPVSDELNLDYFLHMSAKVRIDLYSIDGKLLKTLLAGELQQGHNHRVFDVSDIKPGSYIIHFRTSDDFMVKSVFLTKQ